MKGNIILLIIGSSILIISIVLSFIFKDKANYNRTEYQQKQNKNNREINIDSKVENKVIFEKIKKIEQEVLELKQEVLELKQEINILSKENNILLNENNPKDRSFKPILNYNLFKEKNSVIIDLYKKGKSKEEMAKILNKSIREIEMVISLIE